MNNLANYNYIIKNSTGEILRFYLDQKNKINYDLYDNNQALVDQYLVSEDTINSFSVDIDNRDRIHLIYLTNHGNVCYSLYSNNRWAKKIITQFDMRSNSYSNLILRVNKEDIHILFSFSNLINPKVWTIQHLIGTKGNWEKTNVISFTSLKTSPDYSIDFDKFDNIHMIYTSIVDGIQKIFYVFYSPSSKKWSPVPKLLSEHNSSFRYPIILVDRIDNIHILWLTCDKDSYEIKYKHLSQVGANRNKWKEESLPNISYEYSYPMISEEKDSLIIHLMVTNKILYLASQDYGHSWMLSDAIPIPQDIKIYIAKYRTNLSIEKDKIKSSQIFLCFNERKIILKNDLIEYVKNYTLNNEHTSLQIDIESKESINTLGSNDKTESLPIDKEENTIDNVFYNNSYEIEKISKDLLDITNEISNVKDILNGFISQFRDIDNTLQALKHSIDTNNQCFIDIDKKINDLNNKYSRKGFWSRIFNRT